MKFLKHLLLSGCIAQAIFLWGATVSHGAVVTYIDLFTTSQMMSTNNATVTNTVASSGALGGFRTMTLSTLGGDPPEEPPNTGISVSAMTQRFTLSTPTGATSSFEIKWGGAGGTSGLGGIDFTGGYGTNYSLGGSTLNFSLRSADQPSSFSWAFTDTSSNIATYSGSFPARSATSNPALPYAISLASFSGSGIVDWSSINFITLSGGGLELDLSIPTALSVTATPVPEPGTWAAAALLLGAAVYTFWRRRQNTALETSAAA